MKKDENEMMCAFSSSSFSKCRSPSLFICVFPPLGLITCPSLSAHLNSVSCNVSMYTFGIVNKSQIILSTLFFSCAASFAIIFSLSISRESQLGSTSEERYSENLRTLGMRMCETRRKSQNLQVCGCRHTVRECCWCRDGFYKVG